MINKKGVSLMISYVILITLTIGLAVAVFSFLKYQIPNELESCKQGTSIIISDYSCSEGELSIYLKNQGNFNIEGFFIRVAEDSAELPTLSINLSEVSEGAYIPETIEAIYFSDILPPRQELQVNFSYDYPKIQRIQIEPFIFNEENSTIILCNSATITQNLQDCLGCIDGNRRITNCGIGECQATGEETCNADSNWIITADCISLDPPEDTETSCTDELDNDCDGKIDCEDTDSCSTDTTCI